MTTTKTNMTDNDTFDPIVYTVASIYFLTVSVFIYNAFVNDIIMRSWVINITVVSIAILLSVLFFGKRSKQMKVVFTIMLAMSTGIILGS